MTLASWSFSSGIAGTNYPAINTEFAASSGTCSSGSTFNIAIASVTYNTSKNSFAFTTTNGNKTCPVITIKLKLASAIPSGTELTLTAYASYNNNTNKPCDSYNITVSTDNSTYSTTGLGTTSWTLSNGNPAEMSTVYTTQANLAANSYIYFKFTGQTRSGNGQGYFNNPIITMPAASCTDNSSVGAASLNGSFASGGVTSLSNLSEVFAAASSSAGSNCSLSENGFVWSSSANTSNTLKKDETGVTYIAGGTPDGSNDGAFKGTLSGTWTENTTYYYRSYVKNNGDNVAYNPASDVKSFTPRKITFNSNGGSSVDAKYIASGGVMTAPTAPTKADNVFAGWYSNEGLTSPVNWGAAVTASATYYAKWYTVTVNVKDEVGNTLSGSGKPTASCTGTTLSTAAGSEKYVFKEWQVSNAELGSSKETASNSLTNITGNVTVTAVYHAPISLTKGTNTGASTFNFSSNPIGYGETLTITCAADAGYKGNPTVTADGTHGAISVVSATSVTIANVQSAMTVNISYAAKETATVKLHVAGSTSTISGTRYEGDSYTLPSEAAECPDMGLYGWYTTDYEHATTAPSGANFKLPGASATLAAGDNDFYAVYATVTPDAADTYTKITTTGELVTGDYLIVGTFYSGMYAMKNAYETSESTMADESRTVTDNQITNPASTKAEYIWHFTKSNSTITIYSANSSKYFGFSSNHVALMNSSQNLTYEVSDGKWAIYSGSDYLTYSSYFQRGASKVYDVSLYKRDQSISGPYTTSPSCTTHSLSTAVTPVSTGTAVAGKTVIGEGKTTTVTATPEEGYAFRYWTISGDGSTMTNTSDGKSTDNPVTVTMGTEDATITAHFAERVAITFNVPTGVTKPSNSYTDVALPTPVGFPSAVDEDCWAFAGWTESSSVNSTSAPATLYPAGTIYSGSQESAFTLYAVYSRNKYLAVYNSSLFGDLTDYVITYAGITDHEYALTGVADDNNAVVLDVIDNRHDKVLGGLHYYTIDNPSETAVWTLSGSSGSWVLQNKATGKYLNLSSTSSPMISGSSATMAISGDDMDYTFTKSGNKLVITSSGASVGTGDPTEDEEFWLYKLSSSKYMTTPAEPTYAVTYKVSGQSDVVKNVNACTGITASDIPDAPADDAIGDCADTFMGWSAKDLGSADDQDAPDDLFTTYTNAPYLTGDLTLYAVFATAGGGGSSSETLSASEITTNFTSSAVNYGDDEKSWTDGNITWAGRFSAVQYGPYMQLKNDNNVYIKIVAPGKITSVAMMATLTSCSGSGCNLDIDEHSNATATISLQTAASGGTTIDSGTASNKSITLSQSSGNNSTLYIKVDGATKIWGPITAYYSSVSYSNYKTSCSCNGNPTVTSSASLKGTFSLSEVGVTVADLSVGSGCKWTDAGFVWSPSTNTTPTVGGTNCTKVQVLTSGTDATFDGTLEGEFEVDATYYYRAYGKNEYESGSYQYSTSVSSFIPRSVEFDSKGGSSVDTKYVASGTPVTAPDDPTKTGYDFSKWQLSGADYNFSSNVTASITLDAVWTAQIYSITYKDQGNVAFSGSHVNTPSAHPTSHTYGTETTLNGATKSGYTFGGWYTNEDCTGDPVTTLGATAFDEDITLYAKWTAKKNYFIDRMHGNWDGEHTEPTTGYNCYVREGAGYTVPDLSDNDTGSNSCVSGHAHFIGWVVAGKIGAQGQLLSEYTVIKGGTVQTAGTDGTIYYAVWAEE